MKKLLATLLLGMALTVAALPAAAQESGNTVNNDGQRQRRGAQGDHGG